MSYKEQLWRVQRNQKNSQNNNANGIERGIERGKGKRKRKDEQQEKMFKNYDLITNIYKLLLKIVYKWIIYIVQFIIIMENVLVHI